MTWLDLIQEGRGGTLGISGWGCAAGNLEPLTYTRASSAEFCYPIKQKFGSPAPPPPPPREASASHAGDRRGARVTVFVFFCSFLLLFTPLLSRVTLPRYSFEMQNITPALPASHLFSFSLLLVSNNIMLDNYRARNCHWATAELFPEWCSYRIWRPQCT